MQKPVNTLRTKSGSIFMLNRIIVILSVVTICFSLLKPNKTPLFYNYSSNFEVYLQSSSSSANIVSINTQQYKNLSKIKGESFKTDKDNFDLQNFLLDLDARVLFIETIEEGISYYCFSNTIKYRELVKDNIVNVHVFISNLTNQITVGSPLIFGGF